MIEFRDFENTEGNLSEVLREIADWIDEYNPKQPVIVPISQDGEHIHFRLYLDFEGAH